jgi:hypothetical protein
VGWIVLAVVLAGAGAALILFAGRRLLRLEERK